MGWNDEHFRNPSPCKKDCRDRAPGCREKCIAFMIYDIDRIQRSRDGMKEIMKSATWYFRDRYLKREKRDAKKNKKR